LKNIFIFAFAGTLPKPHKPTLRAKLCQRACKPTQRRKEIFKNAPPHVEKTKWKKLKYGQTRI